MRFKKKKKTPIIFMKIEVLITQNWRAPSLITDHEPKIKYLLLWDYLIIYVAVIITFGMVKIIQVFIIMLARDLAS